nr:hypothetical protein [Tanacetum cinerariifolium]
MRYPLGVMTLALRWSAVGDFGQLGEQVAPFLRALSHVGQHAEAVHAVVAVEQLDQGVGVSDRGRLVADHQQHFLCRAYEADHRFADPGSGVDHQ